MLGRSIYNYYLGFCFQWKIYYILLYLLDSLDFIFLKSTVIRCCEIISFLPEVMTCKKPQTENETQGDETEEL